MYPSGEVYMAYVSLGIPLIWGVKVLHSYICTHIYKATITTDDMHTMNKCNMHTKLVRLYKINDFMIWDNFITEKYDVEWSYIKKAVLTKNDSKD